MTEQTPRDIHDLMSQGAVKAPPAQLDAEGKVDLAQSGALLTIMEIQIGDDPEYGACWDVTADTPDRPVQFRLYFNERRDVFMQQLSELVAQGPVSGLVMRSKGTRKGNAYVWLEPA